MKISIVTATFNSQDKIVNNINSIIKQSYDNFEHIIVDNKSSDNTIELIQKIYLQRNLSDKLKIICEQDAGISDAFNKGIKAATGDIIGILNSDDQYFNEFVFERVVNAFKDENIIFVHGDILFVDPIYGTNIRKPLLCDIREAVPFNHPSMFFRKSVYNQFGIFDLKFRFAMDYELLARYEKSIPDFRQRGYYIQDEPIAIMNFGGASWKNEIKGIIEGRLGLIKNELWNLRAFYFFIVRFLRIILKKILSFFRLKIIIKFWRYLKWGNKID